MKKFLIAMLVVASTMTMSSFDAEAKRLGSGSSIGKQSNNVSRQATPAAAPTHNAAAPAATPAATPAVAPPKPGIPWKGIAGGLIGGALLAAALSHLGLGGALASMLGSFLTFALIGLAIFFVVRFFRNRNRQGAGNAFNQPAFAGAPSMPSAAPEPMAFQNNAPGSSGSNLSGNVSNANWTIPADFDVPGFLRNAKTYFIRLQAAWDKADINDLREFTTAEMYAELKLQIQERGASSNVTDVVTLNADMLGVETTATEYLASVKFSGMIKESASAPSEAFTEVWNLSKSVNGQGGWVLAGIQQM
ncbi:MAG: Tim44-like domain-containing protein [Undibacterium sp.]|nr:Tim44-like domain-containing protein [Undibacterium sp.]MDP1979078.1 Tim44-like domain-containing protein [Undibacterium sp.]